MGQMATQFNKGNSSAFPSDTVNPREDCKAITTRSGKELKAPEPEPVPTPPAAAAQPSDEKEEEEAPRPAVRKLPPPYKPPMPYPQRVRKQKIEDQYAKFLEIFKKIEINIPLIEALGQMPKYMKFLKDAVAKKRKYEDHEMVALTSEVSGAVQQKMASKLKDPGSFTLPCVIGDSKFNQALCDLGASINLMPLSIYKKLGLKNMKPTSISL